MGKCYVLEFYSILDTETTGKLDPAHRIIELSLRRCDKTGNELEHYLERYNPERNIDKKALEIHGITVDELKKEKTFKEKISELSKRLEKSLIIAHNGDWFDIPMLKNEFERCEVPFPEIVSFDTMVNGCFATELGKSPTVGELCFALDVPYDPALAHSAGYDTEALKQAFFNGLKYGWFKPE